jgi:hypothetical protein
MIITTFSPPVLTERSVSAISIDDREKQVREFVEAFNTRKIEKMLELADENIQWLSIDGVKISVETEGKKARKPDSVELKEVDDLRLTVELSAIWREDNKVPALRKFIEIVRKTQAV